MSCFDDYDQSLENENESRYCDYEPYESKAYNNPVEECAVKILSIKGETKLATLYELEDGIAWFPNSVTRNEGDYLIYPSWLDVDITPIYRNSVDRIKAMMNAQQRKVND